LLCPLQVTLAPALLGPRRSERRLAGLDPAQPGEELVVGSTALSRRPRKCQRLLQLLLERANKLLLRRLRLLKIGGSAWIGGNTSHRLGVLDVDAAQSLASHPEEADLRRFVLK